MISLLYEILNTIRRNKMRTFLTGFAVAWGIFMLIVLLGAGNGLKNGFAANWGSRLINVVQIWGGRTNIPYAGFQAGRRINLDDRDLRFTSTDFPGEVNFVVGNVGIGSRNISCGTEYIASDISGVSPQMMSIEGLKIDRGRFVNELDIREKRKTIVISRRAADVLFKQKPAIGRHVNLNGIIYTVVGVYYIDDRQDATGSYIPLTTAQVIYNKGIGVSNLAFTLGTTIDSEETNTDFTNRYKARFARLHQIAPSDNAIWYWNRFSNYLQMSKAGNFINIAVWVIGIFTLISGIVGVSNIMLITVRERTREFGIRKAIGASPGKILRLVVTESIIITAAFGYAGLVCGVGVTELLANSVFTGGDRGGRESISIFVNPTVDLNVAIQATVLLIVAGTLAGFFPALKAVRIKTIEALNSR
ncbi:MAG: ABC transporter permease [Prevotellaceae bacterium]|jgi:putative ABC transport system permease protein|nr:ABC transporter permease [Prevotellaceae bacterium]